MSGTNGFHPVQNLSDRQRCPKAPTKRKYPNGDVARAEVERRSVSAGLPIEAYLCDGCGQYHLTKSAGGDSTILPDGKFSVGEFRALAPDHPVFANAPEPDEQEAPIVPGDFDTRVRFARALLEQTPEPTSNELCEAMGGCSKDSLKKVMLHLGYRNTRGRHARWVKVEHPIDVPVVHRDTGTVIADPMPDELPVGPTPAALAEMWVDLDPGRIGHLAIGDLIAAYAAAGFDVRIQIGSHA